MQIQEVETDKLVPYDRNPRVNDHAVAAVAKSIREFGFRQPIVTDENLTVLVGHTRLKAAKELGLSVVPVHVAEGLTEAQKKAYRLADNKLNEMAEWDTERLAIELESLRLDEFDLNLTGFSEGELFAMLEEAGTKIIQGSKEYGEEDFSEFEHTCPKCGFEFNGKA